MKYKYLFGPVPSRRLGRSLGVDLTPHKTCSLDCVYCECGKTTDLTLKRKQYVPAGAVINELRDFLEKGPELDFVTFSGAGEPTLHSGIGKIIDFLKKEFPQYKVAVLTNSTLLNKKQVRKDLMKTDVIVPSFDAVSEGLFKKVNRPHAGLKVSKLLSGLISLRKEFHGQIWLEIFLVPGLNDTKEELCKFNSIINRIKPDKVQLNTLHRPGTEHWVKPINKIKMLEISKRICNYSKAIRQEKKALVSGSKDAGKYIYETIKRRPLSFSDILKISDLGRQELQEHLKELLKNGKIIERKVSNELYFTANK